MQHRTVLTIFSLILWTIIIAQMLSTGGKGAASEHWMNWTSWYRLLHCKFALIIKRTRLQKCTDYAQRMKYGAIMTWLRKFRRPAKTSHLLIITAVERWKTLVNGSLAIWQRFITRYGKLWCVVQCFNNGLTLSQYFSRGILPLEKKTNSRHMNTSDNNIIEHYYHYYYHFMAIIQDNLP